MAPSIVAGHRIRPASREGERDAPAPDEDAFTLAVAAWEGLPASGSTETLHLVGAGGEIEDWALREALGLPTLQLRHHAAGATSLFAVLSQAATSEAPQGEVVIAVDLPSASGGGGVVAFRIAEGRGLALLGHHERGHPDWKTPDATEWVGAGRRALGPADAAPAGGELYLVAPAAPPVLLQRWAQAMPGFPVVAAPPVGSGVGDAPTIGPALALHDLAHRLAPGRSGLLAVLTPGRSTSFLGVRADAGVAFSGDWDSGPEPPEQPTHSGVVANLGSVSEGAYVPRPTYLDELPSRWRLAADRCGACGTTTFPVRRFCRHCGATDRLERIELPRHGLAVLAATTVAPGAQPTEFDAQVEAVGAYDVVIAEVGPGLRVTLQVTDAAPRSLRVGDKVDTRLRRIYPMEGEWRYGLKAVPSRPA